MPPPLTGLKTWYDFSDASTIFEDTSRTDLAELDDLVAGVTDKSGNGYHLSQAAAANRPRRKVGVRYGLDAAFFGTASTVAWLDSPTFSLAQPFSYAAVFRVSSGEGNGPVVNDQATGTAFMAFYNMGGGPVGIFINAGSNVIGDTDVDEKWSATLVVWDSTDSLYVNGTLDAEGTSGSSGIANGVRIGGSDDGLFSVRGLIGEVLIYDHALDAAEQAAVYEYLAAKWGIIPRLETVVQGSARWRR